jgi:hypothetical protein
MASAVAVLARDAPRASPHPSSDDTSRDKQS